MEGSGWVRLHRKSIESQAFQNDSLWKVWTWCIMKANHQDNWVSIQTGRGLSQVFVERGQFIFGRKSAAKELRMKPSSIRNRMEKLKNMRNVDIQPDTHYSIITIINYDTYNSFQDKEDRQEDNQRTGKGQAKDTNKNDKNVKNEKKELELPDFINPETWKAFKDHRRKMRLIMTPHAEKLIINKLIGFHKDGHDPNAALDEAIEKSWRSVFAPKKEELSEADQIRKEHGLL